MGGFWTEVRDRSLQSWRFSAHHLLTISPHSSTSEREFSMFRANITDQQHQVLENFVEQAVLTNECERETLHSPNPYQRRIIKNDVNI